MLRVCTQRNAPSQSNTEADDANRFLLVSLLLITGNGKIYLLWEVRVFTLVSVVCNRGGRGKKNKGGISQRRSQQLWVPVCKLCVHQFLFPWPHIVPAVTSNLHIKCTQLHWRMKSCLQRKRAWRRSNSVCSLFTWGTNLEKTKRRSKIECRPPPSRQNDWSSVCLALERSRSFVAPALPCCLRFLASLAALRVVFPVHVHCSYWRDLVMRWNFLVNVCNFLALLANLLLLSDEGLVHLLVRNASISFPWHSSVFSGITEASLIWVWTPICKCCE